MQVIQIEEYALHITYCLIRLFLSMLRFNSIFNFRFKLRGVPEKVKICFLDTFTALTVNFKLVILPVVYKTFHFAYHMFL